MPNVKPLPKPALTKPATLSQVKKETVAAVEAETGEDMPTAVKKLLFKSITKASNGSMKADELNAITAGCKSYMELDAFALGKKR